MSAELVFELGESFRKLGVTWASGLLALELVPKFRIAALKIVGVLCEPGPSKSLFSMWPGIRWVLSERAGFPYGIFGDELRPRKPANGDPSQTQESDLKTLTLDAIMIRQAADRVWSETTELTRIRQIRERARTEPAELARLPVAIADMIQVLESDMSFGMRDAAQAALDAWAKHVSDFPRLYGRRMRMLGARTQEVRGELESAIGGRLDATQLFRYRPYFYDLRNLGVEESAELLTAFSACVRRRLDCADTASSERELLELIYEHAEWVLGECSRGIDVGASKSA